MIHSKVIVPIENFPLLRGRILEVAMRIDDFDWMTASAPSPE